MRNYKETFEIIANDLLKQLDSTENCKPNYSNRDFFNILLIFQNAIGDKMFDLQNRENMELSDRENMAIKCGEELRKLIKTYTGLDTTNINDFNN